MPISAGIMGVESGTVGALQKNMNTTDKTVKFASEAIVEQHARVHLLGRSTPTQVRSGAVGYGPWLTNMYERIAVRLGELIAAQPKPSSVAYLAIATSNDVTTCECCGRQNLAKTIVIQTIEDGAAMGEQYYGTDCAATLTGASKRRVTRAVQALAGASNPKPWQLFA